MNELNMKKMTVISGNCILENLETTIKTSEFLLKQANQYNFDLIYKSSFKKDNRSSETYYIGPTLDESAQIFQHLKDNYGLRTLTDFHNIYELEHGIINYIDVIQIPAYLCMQTELVLAIAKIGKTVNIKKGQFLHPEDVGRVVKKVESTGNKDIILTERGTCFGYRDLVVDPRSFYIMKQFGYPVIFDVGHSVRKYGVPSANLKYGGAKEYINTLASAALATKINGIFVEVHPDPPSALCDAATQLSFDEFISLMNTVKPIWDAINV